jgi:soluble lytic murein transglycosylase-like protein
VEEIFKTANINDYQTYIVNPGDCLWDISQKYGVSVELIKSINGLISDLIYPGQHLKIMSITVYSHRCPSFADIIEMIYKSAQLVNVDPILICGIAYAESDFGRNAGESSVGAYGIMQLTDETARELGIDRHEPWQNILGGTIYIKRKLAEFDGDVIKALTAYNWGPEHVKMTFARYGKEWLKYTPGETQDYVAKIMGYMKLNSPRYIRWHKHE